MQCEETYIVEFVDYGGTVNADPYSDMEEALNAYHAAAQYLGRGEKVKLHRYTTVVLASAVRAK